MVPQDSYQHNVGCSWHGPQQGQTVAAMADCNRAPEERKRIRQRGGHYCREKAGDFAVKNRQTSCAATQKSLYINQSHPKLLYVF